MDYIRKFQWNECFTWGNNLERNRNRFGPSLSKRWVPEECIPSKVNSLTNEIIAATNRILSDCPACFPESNLCQSQHVEISRIKSDSVVLPADKGQRWVIMTREQYRDEAYRQLNDTNNYSKIDYPLSKQTSSKIVRILKQMKSRKFISYTELNYLMPPANFSTRRFYLLPKIHKTKWIDDKIPPGRPIVSDVNSESRSVSNMIDYFLKPLAQMSQSFLLDTFHMIAILRELTIPNDSFLFTIDVESLYTKTPVNETTELISELFLRLPDPRRPDLSLLTLLKLILDNNDFSFDSNLYKQISGVAMGKAFAGSFCNIFMNFWENSAIAAFPLKPLVWVRYQDDIFGVWSHSRDSFEAFFAHLNNFHPNIKLTYSINSKEIPFLDLMITNHNTRLSYGLWFKPTDSHYILNSRSHHPPHTHKGVIYSQIYRASTHSSDRQHFCDSIRILKRTWLKLNFSRSLIRETKRKVLTVTNQFTNWDTGYFPCKNSHCYCSFSDNIKVIDNPHNKVKYPIIHRITCDITGVIYIIKCKRCSKLYVGETSRTIVCRIKEHVSNIRSGDPNRSPIAKHFNSDCALIDFTFYAIEHCPIDNKRIKRESHWIKTLRTYGEHGLNSIVQARNNETNLILPFSQCSYRIYNMIKTKCNFSTNTNIAFKNNKNLKSLLK